MRKLKLWFLDHEEIFTMLGIVAVSVAIFIAVILAGCASPITVNSSNPPIVTAEGKTVYVKNSLWQDVPLDTVGRSIGRSLARGLSDSELLTAVNDYNTGNIDDFLRVYYNTAPDIDHSPPVDVFIVRPTDYHVNMAQTGIARSLLVDNSEGWRRDSQGQLLFIDHVPPPPVITPPASMYEWYALYVVDSATGNIIFEDHCGYNADESFTGQWITMPEGTFDSHGTPGGGWASVDAYFYTTYTSFGHEVMTHPGWTLVEHQLYTDPTP